MLTAGQRRGKHASNMQSSQRCAENFIPAAKSCTVSQRDTYKHDYLLRKSYKRIEIAY